MPTLGGQTLKYRAKLEGKGRRIEDYSISGGEKRGMDAGENTFEKSQRLSGKIKGEKFQVSVEDNPEKACRERGKRSLCAPVVWRGKGGRMGVGWFDDGIMWKAKTYNSLATE